MYLTLQFASRSIRTSAAQLRSRNYFYRIIFYLVGEDTIPLFCTLSSKMFFEFIEPRPAHTVFMTPSEHYELWVVMSIKFCSIADIQGRAQKVFSRNSPLTESTFPCVNAYWECVFVYTPELCHPVLCCFNNRHNQYNLIDCTLISVFSSLKRDESLLALGFCNNLC